MRLQIFGIDRQHGFQHIHGLCIFPLQKQNASEIVQRHAISRILCDYLAQMIRSLVVTTVTAQDFGIEKMRDRKSTRLNSSHGYISYAVFCLKKKKNI